MASSNVRVWRCEICGATYLGVNWPSNCPFCGAHFEYIKESIDYPLDIRKGVTLTDAERKDLEAAMDIEITNLTFYRALGKMGDPNSLLASAYRALAKVETEHLGVYADTLEVDAPAAPANPLPVHEDWISNIEASHKREGEAVAFYTACADRATSPRVKQIFTAIAEVETDHQAVDEFLLAQAKAQ